MVCESSQRPLTVSLILLSALNIYVLQAIPDLFPSNLPTELLCNFTPPINAMCLSIPPSWHLLTNIDIYMFQYLEALISFKYYLKV
jgi:hypothetical protein